MKGSDVPCECGGAVYDEGGFGLAFCLTCGLGRASGLDSNNFVYQDRLPGHQSYTRLKRFKVPVQTLGITSTSSVSEHSAHSTHTEKGTAPQTEVLRQFALFNVRVVSSGCRTDSWSARKAPRDPALQNH